MEALIILIILAILVLIIINAANRNQKQNEILNRIKSVENKLMQMNDKLQQQFVKSEPVKEKTESVLQQKTDPVKEAPAVKEEKPAPAYIHPKVIEPPVEKATPAQPTETVPVKKQQQVTIPQQVSENKQSWWEKWVAENPDIEKFIGENLANKIGIAVLVLGIGFFVKYAIDKEWINQVGRVSIGLLCGAALIFLAHRLKEKYRSFSSVLVGGGLTVLYFTIALGFHQYHLFSQTSAFIIMIVITAFAVVLSLLYNRTELAVLATIGGFVTPFLLSTGENNYISLFIYLCILNTGLLALSYFKKWGIVHYIAVFFTTIIFGGWLVNQAVNYNIVPYKAAILFASLFYVQFIAMAIINKLRTNELFSKFDFSLLLGINALYFSAGMFILSKWNNGDSKGLFTIILAIINFVFAWAFFKRFKTDKNFIYLLIGLTLTYISLTAPVQLNGNYITLFWAAETVLLFWLYQRSQIKLMKIALLIVFAALLVSLLMDWIDLYAQVSENRMIIFNKAYLTSAFVSIALFVYYSLLYKEADSWYLKGFSNRFVRNTMLSAGILILYIAGMFELNYQLSTRQFAAGMFTPYSFFYTAVFAAVTVLLLRQLRKHSQSLLLAITGYVFIFYCTGIVGTKDYFVNDLILQHKSALPVAAHWAGVLLLFWLMLETIHSLSKNYKEERLSVTTYIIAAAYLLVISFSLLYPWLILNNVNTENSNFYFNLYNKAVLTISWSISSFVMMWLGLRNSFKPLRWGSIILFGITLVKLFLYDIRNIPAGGKIAAFILLGVLLLVISFMYQRLKKLIIDDEKQKA